MQSSRLHAHLRAQIRTPHMLRQDCRKVSNFVGRQICDLRHSLFAPVVRIRFFCLVRLKIQPLRSAGGSKSGTFGPLSKKKKKFSDKIRILLLLIFSINSLFGCARREMHDDLHNFHAYKKALPCTRRQKYGV